MYCSRSKTFAKCVLYCSELVGQSAIIQQIEELKTQYKIQNGKITITCDGESALDVIRYKTKDKVTPRHEHCDIIGSIVKLRDIVAIDIECKHVEGHQDDYVEFDDLDRLSQLDVMMDNEAKLFMDDLETTGIPDRIIEYRHPLSFGPLKVKAVQIYEQISSTIYNTIADIKLLHHWIDKGRFQWEDVENIDWHNQEGP